MPTEIIIAIIGGALGGSAIAALINQIGEGIRQRRRRKEQLEDKKDDKHDVVTEALKWVMYDRIRFLGREYIAAVKINFDDRRILNEMHRCYHEGLGGNGDLDTLMKQVNSLPLAQ